MKNLFEDIKLNFSPQTNQNQRDYWIEQIWKGVKKKIPNLSYEKVFWRINNNVKPCNTQAIRDLYYRLEHERKDPRSPYQNYAHAFFARTCVKKQKI